jgi:hypothetical protein
MFKKPQKNHVYFYRHEGHYNLLNPNEKSAQYVFLFPHLTTDQRNELGISSSFLVDLEKDCEFSPEEYTPLECLKEILEIYNSYWFHTGKEEVKKTIEYLESIEEEQEKLRHEYEIKYAKAKVEYWTNKLNELQVEREFA